MANEVVEPRLIDVALDVCGRVNFAFQQNGIPVIRRVEIRNQSREDWKDVVCRFKPSPEWAGPFEQHIALIPAQSDYALSDVPIELNFNYLAALSDRVRGELAVEIHCRADAEPASETLFGKSVPVEVYAYDEWTGLETLPEILAAFATPNLAVVEQLLGRAATLLGKRTDSSALDGYQKKSRSRVFSILDCLYDAVREQGIRYSNPPASFENTCQRIRFGEQILKHKLATCLDLCLLFAALMEQCGLRPMILMHKGHAYAGCWLIEDSLAEPSIDDLQSVRKRVDLDEFIVFETTLACEGQKADFNGSVSAARKHLNLDAIFERAIDIFRCRAYGIRPLPLKRDEAGVDLALAQEESKSQPVEEFTGTAPKEFAPVFETSEFPSTPEGRVDHWKQQLLDLTLRNRLLNFRPARKTIPLVCPFPEHLEDSLASNASFQILPQSKLMAGLDPRNLELMEQQASEDPVLRHLTEELKANRLRSPLDEPELSNRLLDLYRQARSEMEESGANTLYLALGFLEWKEAPESDRSQKAPILLIPVRLERKSIRQGFSLQRYDEDPMVNVTLLEMLKRDFEMEIPGVNPPPEDESGVDVSRVLWLFQQAVKDMKGWEARREIWLGQFSFNKFLLWKDLHDRVDSLTRNRVVEHLVHKPGQPFPDESEDIAEHELDRRFDFKDLFCPLSVDSSQLAAVIAASRGKNFVLHGPPGTGKSQTIANLISHCLAEGKRVLFVAEKRAALDVVHRRLSRIGLGPFCLELHSNKSGKAEVLRQFGEALDFGEQHEPEQWSALAEKLASARDQLNGCVQSLHRVYPNGLSAYHCYAWLIARREDELSFAELAPLRMDRIEEQSREHYEGLIRICEDLKSRGSDDRLSREAKAALSWVGATEWTPDWEDRAVDTADDLAAKAGGFKEALADMEASFDINFENGSESILADWVSLCGLLRDAPALPAAFIQAGQWQAFRQQAAGWIEAGRRRDDARKRLEGFNLDAVLEMELAALQSRHRQLQANAGLFAGVKIWMLLKPVRAARTEGAPKWKSEQADAFFEAATELQANQKTIDDAREQAASRLGDFWAGGEADWTRVDEVLNYGDRLNELIDNLAGGDPDRLLRLRETIGKFLPVAIETLAADKPAAIKIERLQESWKILKDAEATCFDCVKMTNMEALNDAGYLDRLIDFCGRIRTWRKDLHNWCRWQEACQRAAAAQLDPLLHAVEDESLPLARIDLGFQVAYRKCFLRRLITLSEILREFWGDEHQQRIEAFKRLDEDFARATAVAVTARLAQALPKARTEECPKNTELGVLQRERAKKARHKSVRKLLSEIPHISSKLKPCFLMSPLSVAQYLDVQQDNFDVVVFDEASQIPVWDAVGAIARGSQVVIVGDPRQLPPTNFFDRVNNEEGALDEESVADLESILDECLGSGLKVRHLRWHYRSRREGLIAFSNQRYYENNLHTFPSPHTEDAGVKLTPIVNGCYERGGGKTNRAEAEAIIAEVVRRLTDPILSKHSIGIVTFSGPQQGLVLDLLDEARREHPEIEGFFSEDLEEPVFVKNLENVQGDERDAILFSICYGPDRSGKVSMNFGPLNRDGGERRLNVAITRAKHEIVVFSTLKAEQIDLSRTRAKGVEHLKAYLEYAERGPRALASGAEPPSSNEGDFSFENEVAGFLRSKGIETHSQVGCSGYRVDLAVVAPGAPGHYALGIECDGAAYRQAATARDRDRLRQSVLEQLGWNIHRVWSTDWWRERDKAEAKLLSTVNAAIENFKPLPVEPKAASETTSGQAEPDRAVQKKPEPDENAQAGPTENEDKEPARYAGFTQTPAKETERRQTYPKAKIQKQKLPKSFHDPETKPRIQAQLKRIVEREGPIVETLLIRRAAEEWGFNRAGGKVQETLVQCLPEALAKTSQNDASVFWKETQDPKGYPHYRVPDETDSDKRKIEEIPVEELRNAALDVMEHYLSCPREDLARETAKRFGAQRMTPNISAILSEAIESLIETRLVSAHGETLRWLG